MKNLKKIILWSAVALVSIIIVGIIGITIFFPKEKIKGMAIEKISAALDRQVTIEDISVSFWGGIGAYLENIKIANAEGFDKKYFLTASALDVKFQFWPLISKEIVVDRLILVDPEIELRKLADGSINYEFGAFDSAAPPEMVDQMSEESKLAVSAISFENLAIENGQCNYNDDSSNIKMTAINIDLGSKLDTPEEYVFRSEGEIKIESLLVVLDTLNLPIMQVDVSYDATYDSDKDNVTLSKSDIDINGIDFAVEGNIPEMSSFAKADFKINSEKIDINNILTLLSDEQKELINDYIIEGDLKLSTSVNYDITTKDTLQYSGKMNLSDLNVIMKDVAKLAVPIASVEFNNELAKVNIPEGLIDDNLFKAMIRARNFDDPYFDGEIDGSLNMAFLNVCLPEAGNPELSGMMTYDLKFEIPMDKINRAKMSGNVSIKNGSYTATTLPENIQSFNADLKMDSRDIILNKFDVQFESSDMSLSGKLADAFPHFIPGYDQEAKKPFLTFELKAKKLNIDKLFPEAVPGEGVNYTKMPVDSIPPIILPDINGRGTGRIDTVIYSKVEFTNINSQIIIEDRKVKVHDVTGDVYTGKVTGETEIDLNDFENPQFAGKFDAQQIEANDFLERFSNFGGQLFGKVNLDGTFNAKGLEPEAILNSLSMDGEALFSEGRLVNFDLVNQLSNQFNFANIEEESLKDFVGAFRVENGRVHFSALKFLSNFGDWNMTGSIGFDGTLDYGGDILLSDKYSQEFLSKSGLVGGIASLLKDEKSSRVNVPFKLTGPYSSPKIALDFSFQDKFQNKVQDNLKVKVGDALKNLFGN